MTIVNASVTGNGDFAYSSTGNALLEFFSKAGSIRATSEAFYDNPSDILKLFGDAWDLNQQKAMQLAMWVRNCRGGAGNRSGFRAIIKQLAQVSPQWIESNIQLIPLYGRWDDLISLFNTKCEKAALAIWTKAILEKDGLACKWAPRETKDKESYHKLRKTAKMSPPEFRKFLSKNTNVVETKMCENAWDVINYNQVPSVAMARLAKTFGKHDEIRFTQWKSSLADADSGNKVNASVLFPHDCITTLRAEAGSNYHPYCNAYGQISGSLYFDSTLANAQFKALKNYMPNTKLRIMPICDFSGSMAGVTVGGSVTALDVSLGLGLYCSDRIGENNPFYRTFIPFSSESKLFSWKKDTFSIAAQKCQNGYCGSTNIESAFNRILDSAVLFDVKDTQMPNCILILSDMQFDQGTYDGTGTVVEKCMKKWEELGYARPKLVYWNLNSYNNSPATFFHKDVALVSGFSPSILEAILSGDDFTPMGVMERTIAKYIVTNPYA